MINQTGTAEERAREAAKVFTDAVNEMGFDTESFADELLRQHRTIQQNAFGAMMAVVEKWAALPETHRDLRNEFTCEKSRVIVRALGPCGTKPPFV